MSYDDLDAPLMVLGRRTVALAAVQVALLIVAGLAMTRLLSWVLIFLLVVWVPLVLMLWQALQLSRTGRAMKAASTGDAEALDAMFAGLHKAARLEFLFVALAIKLSIALSLLFPLL